VRRRRGRIEAERIVLEFKQSGLTRQAFCAQHGLWKRLTIFLEHPELELSNNSAENSMRGVALGRRNWIHIGSQQAGPKIAAILSVVENCRRLKLSVREYLADILPGLADRPIQYLEQLTMAGYLASQPN